jgi:hypothetical protein
LGAKAAIRLLDRQYRCENPNDPKSARIGQRDGREREWVRDGYRRIERVERVTPDFVDPQLKRPN